MHKPFLLEMQLKFVETTPPKNNKGRNKKTKRNTNKVFQTSLIIFFDMLIPRINPD